MKHIEGNKIFTINHQKMDTNREILININSNA